MLETSRGKRTARGLSLEDEPAEDDLPLTGDHRSVALTKLWAALAVPVAGCGLSGSKEPWALGILGMLIALNLVIAPPRSPVSRTITVPLFLFALLSLGSFLPLSESSVPWWRSTFVQDFGVSLGGLRSPQPWVSFETWIVIAVGLIWLWHCLGRGFNESERRWLVRMLTMFVAVIAGLSVWFKREGIDVPFWQRSEWRLAYFGPFPNRNHVGALLAMGAVLTFATAYDSYRRRSPWWPVYSLNLIPILWALVSNTSRAGLGLFLLGLTAWMAFASFSRRSAQRMGVAVAVLLVLVSFFILFGQHILERASLTGGQGAAGSSGRFRLWGECATMIAKAPVLGVGLGCFASVFPFHQIYFDPESRDIHPESDWLWTTAEAGVLAIMMLAVALFNYVRKTGLWRGNLGQKNRKDRRLRNACAVAALILPVHGLVDTPTHQPGLVCIAALLAGLSLRERRAADVSSLPRAGKLRLVFAGFCLFVSIAWFFIVAGFPVLPGTSSARMLDHEATRLRDRNDLAGAASALNRKIAMTPLLWDGYFDRGELSLDRGLPPNAALEDFARMRYLEPHSGVICFKEALIWARYHPAYAPAAWREAMRRNSSRADEFYRLALESLREHPEIRSALRNLASTPKQKLRYLGSCTAAEFADALAELLEAQPTLQNFSSDERLGLFNIWFAIGDRNQLVARLEQDPTWRSAGWPVLAQARAAQDDFRGAYQLAVENLPPPAESSASRKGDLAQLRRDFLFHPTDFSYGFALFEAESSKGLINEALITLEKISQLPNAPARVLYEQATLLSRKGDHAAAWEKMKAYIEKWQVARRDAPASLAGKTDPTLINAEVLRALKRPSPER